MISRLSRASSPPLRTNLLDLQRCYVDTLTRWATRLVAERALHPAPQPSDARRLVAACRLLRSHEAYLFDQPWCVPLVRDILWLKDRARSALQLNRLVHHLPAPCPDCDTLGLIRVDGDDRVWCGHCHAAWSEADYHRLVAVLAWEVSVDAAAVGAGQHP